MLAAVLKRTGQPRVPKGSQERAGDLTKQFHARTTGTGFGSSPTPARGKPVDRGGKPRRWPRPGEMEQKESDSDDMGS